MRVKIKLLVANVLKKYILFFWNTRRGNVLCTECGNRKKNIAIPIKPPPLFSSQATKPHAKQETIYNSYYYFTNPAQDTTNSHSHFNQRERIET